jgi:S-adenosylmethionine-diacylglycerol 3-amino-3-carboxypropyl transferase
MTILTWLSGRVFNLVHSHNLVYNTCWEDPRLDRIALKISADDRLLVITSAGCNVLDYALVGPAHIYAVDMNPRQNALLELKMAAARRLDYDEFFQMFGKGYWPAVTTAYRGRLRSDLSPWAQAYWDRYIRFFTNPRRTFYYRGTSGAFARMIKLYTEKVVGLQDAIDRMLAAETLEEQREIYYRELRPRIWTRLIRFALNRNTTLAMLGVPPAQRRQIEKQYEGGIIKFVQDCVDAVCGELPLKDNYFWRVYIKGSYTPDCCPEYLKESNFERLRKDAIFRISVHTDSVGGFLEKHNGKISRFVLLDHMDWLSDRFFPMLEAEWQAIVDRAAPGARLIWRSGGLRTDYLDRVQVRAGGRLVYLPELLRYDTQLAQELHRQDRVHTYGSFYIADLAV